MDEGERPVTELETGFHWSRSAPPILVFIEILGECNGWITADIYGMPDGLRVPLDDHWIIIPIGSKFRGVKWRTTEMISWVWAAEINASNGDEVPL